MPRIRNAVFRLDGPSDALERFRDAVMRSLLDDDAAVDFEETSDGGLPALHFPACDGLPFPAFASASAACPDVAVHARWEDVAAGRSYSALIRGGTVNRVEDDVPAGQDLPAYLCMSGNGRLLVALCVTPASEGQPRLGCVVTAERDGMFMLSGARRLEAELFSTGDDLVWSRRWMMRGEEGTWQEVPLAHPDPIDPDHQKRLNELADRLLREWLWYSEGDPVENAVEIERFRLYGFTPDKANVRSQGIKRMARRLGEGGEVFEFDNLQPEDQWIRQALERCWARVPAA